MIVLLQVLSTDIAYLVEDNAPKRGAMKATLQARKALWKELLKTSYPSYRRDCWKLSPAGHHSSSL